MASDPAGRSRGFVHSRVTTSQLTRLPEVVRSGGSTTAAQAESRTPKACAGSGYPRECALGRTENTRAAMGTNRTYFMLRINLDN